MKYSVYRNFAVAGCLLGLMGLLVGCFGMSISFESTNPDASSATSTETSNPPVAPQKSIPASASTNQVEHSHTENSSPLLAYRFDSADKAKTQGTLRMSNQTNQPVRLALLARQSAVKNSKTNKNNKTHYDVPAHWDFAPQEGSDKGLILSLPQGNLKLEKGDILVAFAQDGSRRYWGPYVVGETSSPAWNSQSKEWQLVLNP